MNERIGGLIMLSGTVLFAHQNPMITASIERILTAENPGIHIIKALNGAEALIIQSVMRPKVAVIGMDQEDMTGEHLICELRGDIVQPFIMVIGKDLGAPERRKIMRMGANEIMQEPVNVMKAAEMIEEQLKRHEQEERMSLPEATLQRLFAETGIPFDLKGYRYLKDAIALLDSGAAQLEPIGMLYERIGEKYGCMSTTVERNIRYAVGLCKSRMDGGIKVSNRQFIANLMEQKWSGVQKMCPPRVSVYCSGYRLFR